MLRSVLIFALAAAAPLSADVTIRYKSDFKFNSSLPPAITEQAMKSRPPTDSVIRVKGRKGVTETFGFQSLVDTEKKTITMIDPAGKRFATSTIDEYKDAAAHALPVLPPQAAQMLSSMKAHTETKLTGRTADIRGVKAAEREMVMTVDAPEGAPFTGPMIRMVMQLWMADPSEADRVPAVREVADLKLGSYGAMDPGATIQKMLEQMPGMGEGLKAMVEEMSKNRTVLLRSHIEIFMPMFAAMAKQMPQGANNPLGNFNANDPFMQMNQEVAELSTDAIPDSVFQIPEGYKSAPLADLLKEMMGKLQGAAAPQQ